jgi:GDSL-like Lipase/Acylhydrolase family
MRIFVFASWIVFACSNASFGQAPAAAAPEAPAKKAAAPAVKLPAQAPDVAAPKLGPDGNVNAGFAAAHQRFVETAQMGTAKLVFLGDSITAGWGGHKEIWEKAFGSYEPANFGIGGDRTQHVLWRIQNGELETIKPKAVVLMIGTNNSATDSAAGIAKGISEIVKTASQNPFTSRLPARRVGREQPSTRQTDRSQCDCRKATRWEDGALLGYWAQVFATRWRYLERDHARFASSIQSWVSDMG